MLSGLDSNEGRRGNRPGPRWEAAVPGAAEDAGLGANRAKLALQIVLSNRRMSMVISGELWPSSFMSAG